MGVLGLTPFLQRHCPQVVKALPERLRDFSGKTIVFDGTLVTHRFHFAPNPYQYRHVLGWYRLISELRSNNVHAICVFDGAGRSAAKVLENERRQNARQLSVARWSMEIKRQQRLQSLSKLLQKLEVLPFSKRSATVSKLEGVIFEKQQASKNVPLTIFNSMFHRDDRIQGQAVNTLKAEEINDDAVYPSDYDNSLYNSTLSDNAQTVTWIGESLITDQDFLCLDQTGPMELQHDLHEQLSSLYESHATSSRTIHSISSSSSTFGTSPEEASESKNQLLLTQDEDRLWSDIQSWVEDPRDFRAHVLLRSLIKRSIALSESYARRCKPPTQDTYADCKSILEALGVPCIQCDSPYEAEGLASSLVRHGLAHFVASEDTDVLVYGAPLLRNLTSRHGAIVAISSEEVRRALGLSRAAFTDFALLIGTDFCPRLRNVGPVRALNFISAHSRIERIVKREARYIPPDVHKYLAQVRRARRIFTTLPPVPRRETLRSSEVNKEKVTELLGQFGLSRAAVDVDWDPQTSLAGNYFADNPVAEGSSLGLSAMHFY